MHFIITDYLDGEISLSKAAELLGMTRIELQRKLKEQGIPIRSLSIDDVFADVEAFRDAS
jgi:predicted HTH domain antitoxin